MKKPIHGDELVIRYLGQIVRARCNEVTELPAREPGLARFTIISKTIFQKGTGATLMQGPGEMDINVERVTTMQHRGVNIVSFLGCFDGAPVRAQPAGK